MVEAQMRQIETAEALEGEARDLERVMHLLAEVGDGVGRIDVRQYWTERAAGMRFAVQRALYLSRAGESPALILLDLAKKTEKAENTGNRVANQAWIEGVTEVCRAIFRSGLGSITPD